MNSSKEKKKKIKKFDLNKVKAILLYERVDELKEKMRMRERSEKKKEMQRRVRVGGIKYLKENISNFKFRRNPFDLKKTFGNFNFRKYKIGLEIADRNIEKNRIEYTTRKEALNGIDIQSRLDIKPKDDIEDIKNRIKTYRKTLHLPKKSSRNVIEQHLNYFPTASTEGEENKSKEKKKRRYSCIPPKHGKNYYFLKSMSQLPRNSLNENAEAQKIKTATNFYSSRTRKKPQIHHNPICTTDINSFLKEYDRLKLQLKNEKISTFFFIIFFRVSKKKFNATKHN